MVKGKPKIIFIGTSDFAVPILEKLVAAGYAVLAVITQPDKAVGRRQELKPPPIKEAALKYKIPVFQPEKIANCKTRPELVEGLQIVNSKPDLMIVADYGQIIPREIFEVPKYGCLNIHPSLLPQYRGASPIQAAILNGDKKTGVTIMLLDEKMDHGDIISNLKFQTLPAGRQARLSGRQVSNLTYEQLSQKLAELGAELLIKVIPNWIAGKIKSRPQDHTKATFTKTLTREDGHIDWTKSAEKIERQIRAYTPWPGSFTFWQNKRLKILEARVETAKNPKNPGQTFLTPEGELTVICGRDSLILKKIQLGGGKILSNKEFLRGHLAILGAILF